MNKPNNIRKKALDYAKKRQWDKALEEFSRLVEVEQHNPNLFNEIGDIQLKLGNKREAFKRYHEAIDAYAKVGLHNNAVAVCKKIIRLSPGDDAVYGKMAMLRKRQGFDREAVEYSLTFLEKLLETPDASNEGVRALLLEVVENFRTTPEVLERAAECLLRGERDGDAGAILEKLGALYLDRGMTAEHRRTQERMASIGYVPAAPSKPPTVPEKLETVESHRESGRTDPDVGFNGSVPPHIRRGREGDGASDFGVIDVDATEPAVSVETALKPEPRREAPAPTAHTARGALEINLDPSALEKKNQWSHDRPDTGPDPKSHEPTNGKEPEGNLREYVIPEGPADGGFGQNLDGLLSIGESKEGTAASNDFTAALASEVKADVDEGDYRTHYDLGMAYLEMGLFADAIREFQFATHAPAYQVRSLEMVGRCLIDQGQPRLAVKQLTKGLALVGGDDRAALGIKYNLAIAHEMIGEPETAKTLFEDVYVIDITFRDVQEKVKKYSS